MLFLKSFLNYFWNVPMPEDATGSVVVSKHQKGFITLSASDKVQLDQYTVELHKVELFSEKP